MAVLSSFSFQVQELFRVEYGEVFQVRVPTRQERWNFFEDLILHQAAKAPSTKKKAGKSAVFIKVIFFANRLMEAYFNLS